MKIAKIIAIYQTINDQIVILGKQLEFKKSKISYNENVNLEINKIKQILASTEAEIYEYDEIIQFTV